MKENIEDIIKKNKAFFDCEEPAKGHFERFQKRLEMQSKFNSNRFRIRKLTAYAAILLVCITVAFYLLIPKGETMMGLSDVSETYREIENYYQKTLDEKMQALQQNAPQLYQSYMEDNQAMNNAYKELQKELYHSPNNEFIIESMVANYKTRMDILDRINNKYKETNFAKNEK